MAVYEEGELNFEILWQDALVLDSWHCYAIAVQRAVEVELTIIYKGATYKRYLPNMAVAQEYGARLDAALDFGPSISEALQHVDVQVGYSDCDALQGTNMA